LIPSVATPLRARVATEQKTPKERGPAAQQPRHRPGSVAAEELTRTPLVAPSCAP